MDDDDRVVIRIDPHNIIKETGDDPFLLNYKAIRDENPDRIRLLETIDHILMRPRLSSGVTNIDFQNGKFAITVNQEDKSAAIERSMTRHRIPSDRYMIILAPVDACAMAA